MPSQVLSSSTSFNWLVVGVLIVVVTLFLPTTTLGQNDGGFSTSGNSDSVNSAVSPRVNSLTNIFSANSERTDRLIVTPYITAGEIERAQNLSRVYNFTRVQSYSGFFNVNPTYNSNMFFWFFPAAYNAEYAPVVLWLQGGPGAPSLFGLFTEHGPFFVDSKSYLRFRSNPWSLTHSVLYIDNPVGCGFSFTEDENGFARNERDVSRDLYNALTQFFTMFPRMQSRDFYIAGQSYGGKYAVSIAQLIHQKNQELAPIRINLKGLILGAPFLDPPSMVDYGEYMYNIGLIDENGRAHFDQMYAEAKDLISRGKWLEVDNLMDELLHGDFTPFPTFFKNATGFDFNKNFLQENRPKTYGFYQQYIQRDYVRKAIHVGSTTYQNFNSSVLKYMRQDYHQSVKPWVEELLDAGYRMIIYSSQLDMAVPHTGIARFVRSLKWKGAEEYGASERKIWKVNREIAGYSRTARNLIYLFIRNVGHVAPHDNPEWTFDLLNRFTARKSF